MAKQVLEMTENDLVTNKVLESIIDQIKVWQASEGKHRSIEFHHGFLEGLRLAGAIARGEMAELYDEDEYEFEVK